MAGYYTFVDTIITSVTGAPLPDATPRTTQTWTGWECLSVVSYITAADGGISRVVSPPNCPTDGSGFTTVYIYDQPSTSVHTYHYEQSSTTAEESLIVPITSTVFATPTSTNAAERGDNWQRYNRRSSSTPVAFIVAITVGCVVVAFVVFLIVRACLGRRRKSKLKKQGLLAARPVGKGMLGLRQFYNPASVAAEVSPAQQQPVEFYAPSGLVPAATVGAAGDGGRGPTGGSGSPTSNTPVVQAGPSNRASSGSPAIPPTAAVAEDSELYEPPRAVAGTEGKGKEPVRRPPSPSPQLPSLGADPDEIRSVEGAGGKVV